MNTAALLDTLRPALAALHADLAVRATDPGVQDALRAEWQTERDARRTADPFAVWIDERVGQIAAAWLLSVLFVRTLEDRGLCPPRLKGGADARDAFRRLFPYLTDRDYLRSIFRGLSQQPTVAHVFDPAHNPVWTLGPSAEAATALLERAADPVAGLARFDLSGDTRFLGDVYEHLNEQVQDRYALCQTPDFVEDYLLRHSVDPALDERGIDVTVCDPTCGSGHLLLGAFRRLLAARRRTEPVEVAAHKAIHQVYGADLNPYALAIARFRLVLAYLDAIGARSLDHGRDLRLNVVVADSLLPPQGDAQQQLGADADQPELWRVNPHALRQDDETARVFARPFDVVVGNPPYITPKDEVLRDEYRKRYATAFRDFQLVAPFIERFFELAHPHGWVAAIVGNGFMKREFGSKLIEDFLPTQDLTAIVDTSGAYIPGHGTPTVILFGRNRAPTGDTVRCVMGKRGEPTTPEDPAQGRVWSSIRDHGEQVGYDDEFVSVEVVSRAKLRQHPWSLRGGGAAGLVAHLEANAATRLDDAISDIGRTTVAGADEVYIFPSARHVQRLRVGRYHAPLVTGTNVRDWAIHDPDEIVYPYEGRGGPPAPAEGILGVALWPWRSTLRARKIFGRTLEQKGLPWTAHVEHYPDRLVRPLSITFAFVATHNHFVLDRGGKVFKQHAPIIKLPADATEDDHFALLGYLNSSTACFWMKQVFYPKASGVNDISTVKNLEENNRYEFASTGLEAIPIPPSVESLAPFARRLDALAEALRERDAAQVLARALAAGKADATALRESFASASEERGRLKHDMVVIQEDLDWACYGLFGLCPDTDDLCGEPTTKRSAVRAFEVLAGSAAESELDPTGRQRLALLRGSSSLALIETKTHKRLWLGQRGVFGHGALTWDESCRKAAAEALLAEVETEAAARRGPLSVRAVADNLVARPHVLGLASILTGHDDPDLLGLLTDLVLTDAVPYLPAYVFKPSGLTKRAAWEATWEAQRREDAGEAVEVPLPPKYDSADFLKPTYWSLRGKLDVPKERFILYPDASTDDDPSLVIGWAGWNHAQRIEALYALHKRLAGQREPAALVPLLAGLHELLPWVKQWHGNEDPHGLGQGLGAVWEARLARMRHDAGLSADDLKAWRPAPTTRGRKKAATATKLTETGP